MVSARLLDHTALELVRTVLRHHGPEEVAGGTVPPRHRGHDRRRLHLAQVRVKG